MELSTIMASLSGASLRKLLIWPRPPAANRIWMLLGDNICVRVVHIGKVTPIAYVMIITRPKLVLLVVWPIDDVTVKCYTNDLKLRV